MAFYDTYGDSQNRRLTQQAQNNQALQAFANFLQKGQENNSDSAYKQALARQANSTASFNDVLNQLFKQQIAPQSNQLPMGQPAVMPSSNPSITIPQTGGGPLQFVNPQSQQTPQQTMVQAAMGGQTQSPLQLAGMNVRGMNFQNPNFVSQGQQTRNKKADYTMSSGLRKEFETLPEVRDYNVIQPNISSMEKILTEVRSGKIKNYTGSDQALITMFNKLTDPKSVVRESEYARTSQNIPLLNRISGAIDKVQSGGSGLTNEDREALVIAAEVIFNERGNLYNQRLQEFNNLAESYGLDKSLVTKNLKPHKRGGFSYSQDSSDPSQNDANDIFSQLGS